MIREQLGECSRTTSSLGSPGSPLVQWSSKEHGCTTSFLRGRDPALNLPFEPARPECKFQSSDLGCTQRGPWVRTAVPGGFRWQRFRAGFSPRACGVSGRPCCWTWNQRRDRGRTRPLLGLHGGRAGLWGEYFEGNARVYRQFRVRRRWALFATSGHTEPLASCGSGSWRCCCGP